MRQELSPGMLVRNPAQPEWGLGQVQSALGNRVTANFENAGKLTLNLGVVELIVVEHPSPETER